MIERVEVHRSVAALVSDRLLWFYLVWNGPLAIGLLVVCLSGWAVESMVAGASNAFVEFVRNSHVFAFFLYALATSLLFLRHVLVAGRATAEGRIALRRDFFAATLVIAVLNAIGLVIYKLATR